MLLMDFSIKINKAALVLQRLAKSGYTIDGIT